MKLTPREGHTLRAALRGLSNREVARELGIAMGTVKLHLTHAYAKLRVRRRSEAIRLLNRLAMDNGFTVEADESWTPWFPVLSQVERRRCGEVLFKRADPGDRLYLVEQGTIELRDIDRAVHSGAVLGEIAVLTPARVRTHTAVCASDVELRFLTREQASRHYFTRPDFGYRVLHLITRRLMADQAR